MSQENFETLLKYLAVMQGTFFLGICAPIFWTMFVRHRHGLQEKKWGVVTLVGIVFIGIACTLTYFRAPYLPLDAWYVIASIGFILLDVGLVMSFKKYLKEIKNK
jgi:multidrug transporter EmrE-like cation transporter